MALRYVSTASSISLYMRVHEVTSQLDYYSQKCTCKSLSGPPELPVGMSGPLTRQ